MEDVSMDIEQAAAPATAEGEADVNPASSDDKEKEEPKNDDGDNGDDEMADALSTSSSTDDDSSVPDVDNEDDTPVAPQEAERLLVAAMELKEKGNQHFAAQARDEAVRCYRRGLHRLKKLRKGPVESIDPQVTSLTTTLATNLATVLFQQSKYNQSVAAATQALDLTPMHVKALYRRAVAARKVGSTDQAIGDLQAALTVEPTHSACRKELKSLQQALSKAQAQQKKGLAKAFAGGVSLYDDKKGPKAPPTPEEKEAALRAQKQKWEDECVARMARNEPALSFDEWQAEQEAAQKKAQEEARQKEEERKKREKAEREKRAAERKAKQALEKKSSTASSNDDGSDDSDEELTEAELQALRGYKKTKDGRVTSYFTREVADLAPQQGPQKLETKTVSATASAKGPSAWNRAGTWEERDCTSWCQDHLRTCLMAVRTERCRIVKVDSLTGDASVVWTAGKQRHVFDFHVTMHYSWTAAISEDHDDDGKRKKVKGIVKLPDISSTSAHEGEGVEVLFEGWKRAPDTQEMPQALADRPALEDALQQAVRGWLHDFQEHYRTH
jgi:hypothetical protein